jgi:DNA-binding response OmpR family regulator
MSNTKVLYVEDEINLGSIVKDTLEMRGFEVLMISDGAIVMKSFIDFNPQVVVMDIMLPNVDGISLVKEIRNLDPYIPILFLTAKVTQNDVITGFQTGGNDYLKKPFSMEELILRIQSLTHLAQGTSSAVPAQKEWIVKIGKYIFRPDMYELAMNGEIRTLSHRENELLKMLTRDFQSTIIRQDILLQIWGDDSYFNSRTLDVYIRKLREYLKDDESIKIMTIKGVGYKVFIDN